MIVGRALAHLKAYIAKKPPLRYGGIREISRHIHNFGTPEVSKLPLTSGTVRWNRGRDFRGLAVHLECLSNSKMYHRCQHELSTPQQPSVWVLD